MSRCKVHYRGPAFMAGMLAQELIEVGATVQWRPPEGREGMSDPAIAYVVLLVDGTSSTAIDWVVDRFRERRPDIKLKVEPEVDAR